MRRFFSAIFFLVVLASPECSEGKSGRRAFFYSLLLPGWGQYHAGKAASAPRFLAAELGLWGGYFGLKHLQDIRATHFRAFAADHARARTAGKNETYYDDLGFYESRLQHNRFALYRDGPEAKLYPDSPEFFWEWDREGTRQRYRELRNSSETAARQALFTTGLVVVNHLVAAIHAARVVKRDDEGRAAAPAFNLEAHASRGRAALLLSRRF